MRKGYIRDDVPFDRAFAAARAAECDKFVWRGNVYHTKLSHEVERDEPPVIERIVESR